jgi:DnaK suppressor protein
MAKAKSKKPGVKAKPAARKPTPPKKSAAGKSKSSSTTKKPSASVKKKALSTKKPVVAAKKAPVAAKKAAPLVAKKLSKSDAKQPASASKPIKSGAVASTAPKAAVVGKLTPMAKTAVKPMPIPKEVLILKDKTSVAEVAPSSDKREIHQSDIFSEDELRMFLEALNKERTSLLDKARAAVDGGNIALDKDEMYDEVDLASATVDQNLTFRLLDRDRKLLNEIDHAIQKIQTGDFGYCEGTGEPIPKRRLELRPWCRHSVKYKEQLEKLEKSGRGVVDEDAEMLD